MSTEITQQGIKVIMITVKEEKYVSEYVSNNNILSLE